MPALLRPGDTVIVNRLSRLGYHTAHRIHLIADLSRQDVRFVAPELRIDTNYAGYLVLTICAALTEFERGSSGEWRQAGMALATVQSKHLGPQPGVDEEKLTKVKTCLAAGLSVH
ncbi:hypothetical protein GCM10027346_41160 [Hymenobacter seoulensis]